MTIFPSICRRLRRRESLRDAANVIADAVTVAKDMEIAELKQALAVARAREMSARVNLSTVSVVGRRVALMVTSGPFLP